MALDSFRTNLSAMEESGLTNLSLNGTNFSGTQDLYLERTISFVRSAQYTAFIAKYDNNKQVRMVRQLLIFGC